MSARSVQFVNELVQFFRSKGQYGCHPHHMVVRINGKPVNLWELYSCVIEMGGSYKVNLHNRWDEIYQKLFHQMPLGANVSVALRQTYQRLLVQYERANSSNFVSETVDNDDEDGLLRDPSSNFVIHSSLNQPLNRVDTCAGSTPLSKLYCSLTCDLPNEMDFGLRVATILTNSKEIDTLADFRFIEVIVECCVLYTCSCIDGAYSTCYDHRKFTDKSMIDENVQDEGYRAQKAFMEEVQRIERVKRMQMNPQGRDRELMYNNPFVSYKNCDCYLRFWCRHVKNKHILALAFSCNTDLLQPYLDEAHEEEFTIGESYESQQAHQKNYYKVRRVAELIKNLSYSIEKGRADHMIGEASIDPATKVPSKEGPCLESATSNLLRLLLLLLHSDDQCYRNIALDIVANLSPLAISHLSYSDIYINLITAVYEWCVQQVNISNDIHCLNRCLEILAKLICGSYESINRHVISQLMIQKRFFTRLTELLTCQHDVGLLVSCLDCCLALSENYPKMLLQENHHLIKIIINLLNCEASTFFTKSGMKKIRIVDERRAVPEVTNPVGQVTNLSQSVPFTIQVKGQPQAVGQKLIIPANTNTGSKVVSMSPAVNQLITENETFAINWLHSQYESRASNTGKGLPLKYSDIYSEYFKYNCRVGRKNLISSQAFNQVIKKAFPSVVFLNATELEGLQLKNATSGASGLLTSPILKAHLSTPPKAGTVSISSGNGEMINTNTCANTSTTTTSTLIKNMLATKLRGNSNITESGEVCISQAPLAKGLKIANAGQVIRPQIMVSTAASMNTISAPQQVITLQPQSGNTATGNLLLTTSANNHLGSPAKVTLGTPQPQQFLLVRTIMQPSHGMANSQNAPGTPMRLYLPASAVLTKQAVGVDGQVRPTLVQLPPGTQLASNVPVSTTAGQTAMISICATTSSASSVNVGFTSSSGQPTELVTVSSVTDPLMRSQSLNGCNDYKEIKPETTVKTEACLEASSEVSVEQDSLLKAVLGSPQKSSCEDASGIEGRSALSSVKSSPLLNVLLDKGKLPDFSTTTNTENSLVELNKEFTTNFSQDSINNTKDCVSSSNNITATSTQIATPIVSGAGMSSGSKMYILTTSASGKGTPIAITSGANTSTKFVIQQPITNNTPTKLMMPNISAPIGSTVMLASNVMQSEVVTPTLASNGSNNITEEGTNSNATSSVNLADTNNESVNGVIADTESDLGEKELRVVKRTTDEIEEDEEEIDGLEKKSELSANKKAKLVANSTTINSVTITPVIEPESAVNGIVTGDSTSGKIDPQKSDVTIEKITLTVPSEKPAQKSQKELEYICEWLNCNKTFVHASSVFLHVHQDHVINSDVEQMSCQWGGPEGLGPGCQSLRPKYSLLTHLQDFHCNVNSLQHAALRMQQLHNEGSTNLHPPPPPPAHPGYASNAAFLAIRRHTVNFQEPLKNSNTQVVSPLSTSIRLTAALILRNLAQHSHSIKSSLKSYESFLSELCIFDGRDESRTLAQCLAVIAEEH